jgi:hypothetical protein
MVQQCSARRTADPEDERQQPVDRDADRSGSLPGAVVQRARNPTRGGEVAQRGRGFRARAR